MDILNEKIIFIGIIIVFSPIAIKSLLLSWKLFRIENSKYIYSNRVSGSSRNVLSGKVNTRNGLVRSHEVRAGLAYSKDGHNLEARGNISDDCVDAFLRS